MARRRSAYVSGGAASILLAVMWAPASAGAADVEQCQSSEPTIVGTEGPDDLVGLPGRDVIVGLGGDDHIFGDLGGDAVCGGEGNDTVIGSGTFYFYGGPGDDYVQVTGGATGQGAELHGEAGDDTLLGGPADDYLYPGLGHDTVDGGAGGDTVTPEQDAGPVSIDLARGFVKGQGRDALARVEHISGTPYADRLVGDDGPNFISGYYDDKPPFDTMRGGGGNDVFSVWGGTLLGGRGDDTVRLNWASGRATTDDHYDGGAGDDSIYFHYGQGPLLFDLGTGIASGGSIGHDVALRFEAASGTRSADTLVGTDADNELLGGGGADRLEGLAGNDILRGGISGDTLLGGEGDDLLDGGSGPDTLSGGLGRDTCLDGESVTECE